MASSCLRTTALRLRHNAPMKTASAFRVRCLSSPPADSDVMVGDPLEFTRGAEEKKLVNHTGEESIYKLGKHRSNALELVHKIPPIEVDGDMAVCDGGGGALGHPIEYISLERPGSVEYCKYCALRYTKKKGSH